MVPELSAAPAASGCILCSRILPGCPLPVMALLHVAVRCDMLSVPPKLIIQGRSESDGCWKKSCFGPGQLLKTPRQTSRKWQLSPSCHQRTSRVGFERYDRNQQSMKHNHNHLPMCDVRWWST